MPSLPKVLDTGRGVGPVKVWRQANTDHSGQSDGDVAVSAEIEENSKSDRGEKKPALVQEKVGKPILIGVQIEGQEGQVIGNDFL